MFRLVAVCAAFVALLVGAPAGAAPPISAADFASFPSVKSPVLSPNGMRIAARATIKGEGHLVIIDSQRPEADPRSFKLGKVEVADVTWAGNERLLLRAMGSVNFYGLIIPAGRLVVLDLRTGNSLVADTKSRGIYGGEVLYADPSGASAIVVSQDDIYSTPSVKRIDLATGKAEVIERAKPNVWDWYADEDGVVRAGLAYDARRWKLWYRDKAGDPLQVVKGKFDKESDGSVDRFTFGAGGTGHVVTNERTGRFGVYRYDFKTGAVGAPVFEHAQVDIDKVFAHRVTGEISGVRYEDDRTRYVWFDPKLKALQARLDQALPKAVNAILDMSDDENFVLVWSGGASDPGSYYLLDQKSRRMSPVLSPYAQIDPALLTEVNSVAYKARDGLAISAYLTLPQGRPATGLPLIVMPHGGPFIRDSWEYDPMVQFLASRGYAVFQPQFRGSTGFGTAFVEKGYGEWGRGMQNDLDDGVDWLVKSGQVDPRRVCIVGASYGGYAALWGVIRNPDRYRCAASLSGVTDLEAQLRDNRRSFSATRYFREWRTKVAGEGKFDLRSVSPVYQAAALKTPVLIAHGEKDDTVSVKQARAMLAALKGSKADVTSVFYPEAGHGFSKPEDLQDYLQRLERFLAKHNPA